MRTPVAKDHVFLDDDFPDVVVVAVDSLGFDWVDNAGAGGWEPFVARDGQSHWRVLAESNDKGGIS